MASQKYRDFGLLTRPAPHTCFKVARLNPKFIRFFWCANWFPKGRKNEMIKTENYLFFNSPLWPVKKNVLNSAHLLDRPRMVENLLFQTEENVLFRTLQAWFHHKCFVQLALCVSTNSHFNSSRHFFLTFGLCWF